MKEISKFDKPLSALMLDPLDQEAINELIPLWRRHDLMPKTLKVYQVILKYGETPPVIDFSSISEEAARDNFCDQVMDRYRDIHSDDDFDEEDATVEEMIENNAMIDEDGNSFDMFTAVKWIEDSYEICLVTTEIEL